nr:DUF1068 domain-containing protein [Ipomoea batatas]
MIGQRENIDAAMAANTTNSREIHSRQCVAPPRYGSGNSDARSVSSEERKCHHRPPFYKTTAAIRAVKSFQKSMVVVLTSLCAMKHISELQGKCVVDVKCDLENGMDGVLITEQHRNDEVCSQFVLMPLLEMPRGCHSFPGSRSAQGRIQLTSATQDRHNWLVEDELFISKIDLASREMSRRSGTCLRCCLVIFAVVSALCVSGPAFYWKFKKALKLKASCLPCKCDCSPALTLFDVAPGLVNLSVTASLLPNTSSQRLEGLAYIVAFDVLKFVHYTTDCGKDDPALKEEMEKQFVDLLSEELKLQEAVDKEHVNRMNMTFTEAKRLASEYQKESEKCNAATDTCEVGRERAEVLLAKERKLTSMWEKRARQMGWSVE